MEPQFAWVSQVAGSPQIRWRNLATIGGLIFVALFAGQLAVSWLFDAPLQPELLVINGAVIAGWFVLVVELQRQRVIHGVWRLRFSLQALFLTMVCAALFFGGVGNAIRRARADHAFGEEMQQALRELVGRDGGVYSGRSGGRDLTIFVRRADFSDHDFERMLALITQGGARSCDLRQLHLGPSGVTPESIRRLISCRRLQHLTWTSQAVGDDLVDAFGELKQLRSLSGPFTPEQHDRLQAQLLHATIQD